MIKTESGTILKDINIVLQFRVSKDVDWSVLIENRVSGNNYVANNTTSEAVYKAINSTDTCIIVTPIETNEAWLILEQNAMGVLEGLNYDYR